MTTFLRPTVEDTVGEAAADMIVILLEMHRNSTDP